LRTLSLGLNNRRDFILIQIQHYKLFLKFTVRKQKKSGLSKFFSCFNPKTKDDRRRKRSISNIFLDKIVRQKRMYHSGPSSSSTPTRGSSLTVTDCGYWLAPVWFGFNLMLFILGWMLLALQYYPMY